MGSGEGVCGCIVRTAGKVESVVKWPDKGGNGAVGRLEGKLGVQQEEGMFVSNSGGQATLWSGLDFI